MPDVYAQHAAITVTESAATTLTFQQLQTGAALFERRAMVIHRIEYFPTITSINLLLDDQDSLTFGLATSSSITDLELSNPNIVDRLDLKVATFGTPASAHLYTVPFVVDWTGLPSGGLIIPAFPVYAFAQGVSVAAASTARIRFQFTAKQLKPEEYIELVEASRIIT